MSKTAFLAAWLVFGIWLVACASEPEDEPEASALLEAELARVAQADASDPHHEDQSAAAPYAALLRDCHERTGMRGAAREVHAIGQYLALGDTMLGVHVPLPHAPALARCIEEAVADQPPPGPPSAPHAFASGSFAIDLGGPPPPFSPGDVERHLEAHHAGLKRLVRQAVARGVLPADHFFVREVLEETGKL